MTMLSTQSLIRRTGFAVVSALLLNACASAQDSARDAASAQQQAAFQDTTCKERGYQPDSDNYKQCILLMQRQAKDLQEKLALQRYLADHPYSQQP